MIDVKGTKTQETEHDPARRYALRHEEQRSKTPALLAAFLTGLALYLKSIIPSNADAGQEGPQGEENRGGQPLQSTDEVLTSERPPLDQMPTGTVAKPEVPAGSGGRLVDPMPTAEFLTIGPPVFQDFRPPDFDPSWTQFRWPGLAGMPANDNSGRGARKESSLPDDGGRVSGGDNDDQEDGPADSDPEDADEETTQQCAGEDRCDGDPDSEPCGEDSNPQPVNRAPRVSGPVYLMDVSGCAILAIGLSDLLRHAVDPDGDALSVTNLTVSSGTLTHSGEGWIFRSEPRMQGEVTIVYQVTDGEFFVPQAAYFSIARPIVEGTGTDDTLLGSMCGDDMDGGAGDDNIDGRAGNDAIGGGAGDDHIVAGAGNDVVFGGGGRDVIFGGAGDDHISGGDGDDRLYGGDGDDIVFGDAGDDYLGGGDGDDLLSGGSGNDTIEGAAGDDTILAGAGDDTIDTGSGEDRVEAEGGDDTIRDGPGRDIVLGGTGNDVVLAAIDGDDDLYDGGEGCDTLDYSSTSKDVAIDLRSGTAFGIEIGNDAISGFETVKGGSGDDHLTATDTPAVLIGGEGANTFEFPHPLSVPTTVVHEIVDFKAGDLIRISKYDLFEKILDTMEDHFEEIYGDDFDDDLPIRYGHELVDGMKKTMIEADFNGDEIYETTVVLHGHQLLVIVENA